MPAASALRAEKVIAERSRGAQNLNYPSFAFWCVDPKTAWIIQLEFCLRARRKNKFSHPVVRVLAPVYTLGGGGDRDSELITGMVRASWAGSHRPS